MKPKSIDLISPSDRILPRRKISAYSAILLPFTTDGTIDWDAFCAHLVRTSDSGLTPAINMDTGYVNLIGKQVRSEVLRRARAELSGRAFAAGAFVQDQVGDPFDFQAYARQIGQIQYFGGIPVIFQSFGLTSLSLDPILSNYSEMGSISPQFIAFELGTMFAAFGKINDLTTYEGLLSIQNYIGVKHSSLSRQLVWTRLSLPINIRCSNHIQNIGISLDFDLEFIFAPSARILQVKTGSKGLY